MLSTKMKKAAAVLFVALGTTAAHASFTNPTVTLDTATNLDVSATWNISSLLPPNPLGTDNYTFTGLTNWAVDFWGWTQNNFGPARIYIGSVYAGTMASPDEFVSGYLTQGMGPVHFADTQVLDGRTYTFTADSQQGNSRLVDFRLVASVPEPESYAMFLAGLGLMGAIARRRRS